MKQVEDPVSAATNIDLDAIRTAIHRCRVGFQGVLRSDPGDATMHDDGQTGPSRGHQAVTLRAGPRRFRRYLIDIAQNGPAWSRTTGGDCDQRYGEKRGPAC